MKKINNNLHSETNSQKFQLLTEDNFSKLY